MNLIQLLTDQWAYERITHSRWGASWNRRWRRVGDDEDRRFPSPEPRTDSRSGLPLKSRRWRQLRIVKCDETSSLVFPGKIGFYSVRLRVCGATRGGQPTWARQEGGAPWWVVPTQVPPSGGSWLQTFLLLWNNSPKGFIPFRELLFLHKNNTMVVLVKTASVRGYFHSNHAN